VPLGKAGKMNVVSRLSTMKKRAGQEESRERMYPEPYRTWMARRRFDCFGTKKAQRRREGRLFNHHLLARDSYQGGQ